jgi:hypothetical protein
MHQEGGGEKDLETVQKGREHAIRPSSVIPLWHLTNCISLLRCLGYQALYSRCTGVRKFLLPGGCSLPKLVTSRSSAWATSTAAS